MRARLAALLVLAIAACSKFEDAPGTVTSDAGLPDGGGPDGGPTADGAAEKTYRDEVIVDAPTLYLRLDESSLPPVESAPQVKDEVSQAVIGRRYGTLQPGVAGALAREPGAALGFNGGYLELGARGAFDARAPFSIEVWIRLAPPATLVHVVTKEDRPSSTPKDGWAIYLQPSTLTFERLVNGSAKSATAPLGASSAFRHVVATFDGSTLTLFLDGEVAATVGDVRPALAPTAPLLVGTEEVGSKDVAMGAIDEVAVYDKALSSPRVRAHFSAATRR